MVMYDEHRSRLVTRPFPQISLIARGCQAARLVLSSCVKHVGYSDEIPD